MSANVDHDGWDLHETGPVGADHTVLLVPGGMCTAAFFDDLVKEPKWREASAVPPGRRPWRMNSTADARGVQAPAGCLRGPRALYVPPGAGLVLGDRHLSRFEQAARARGPEAIDLLRGPLLEQLWVK